MADLRGYVEGLINFDGEGGGTTVIANPEGTPTDELNSIQVDNTIYSVGGGGESIVPTPTDVDRGKYLGVKSSANELEYRSINELPNSEGASAGTVLTHTVSGDRWLPPVKELPTYTTGDNGKVLGVSSGALSWVAQSGGGGGVNYSTEEQEIGTWIDGSKVYQITLSLNNTQIKTDVFTNVSNLNINQLISLTGTYNRIANWSSPVLEFNYMFNIYETGDYNSVLRYDRNTASIMYNIKLGNNESTSHQYITIIYTKTTDIA